MLVPVGGVGNLLRVGQGSAHDVWQFVECV